MTGACDGAKITLNFLEPDIANGGQACDIQNRGQLLLGGIDCIGVESCKNLEFTINNNGCDEIIIETIECRMNTCTNANFNFYGISPIGIQSCELPATGSQVFGLERCYANLRSLNCPDPGSCMNQERTLVDPINGFLLSCEAEMSCMNANYNIEITPVDRMVIVETLS